MQSMRGLNSRSVPHTPFWWFVLQCVVLVFALGIFIVSCYAISIVAGGGPHAFLLFDALFLWIVIGGFMAIQRWAPDFYHRLAVIISYTIAVIFLLSAWAWAASVAGDFLANTCYGSFGCFGPSDELKQFGAAMAAGAALGAITWVMVIVLLVFYLLACMRDGGANNNPVPTPYGNSASNAEMGTVKTDEPAVTPAASSTPLPQQQQHQQQQPYVQPQEASHPQASYSQETPYPQAHEMPSPDAQQADVYPPQQTQQQ